VLRNWQSNANVGCWCPTIIWRVDWSSDTLGREEQWSTEITTTQSIVECLIRTRIKGCEHQVKLSFIYLQPNAFLRDKKIKVRTETEAYMKLIQFQPPLVLKQTNKAYYHESKTHATVNWSRPKLLTKITVYTTGDCTKEIEKKDSASCENRSRIIWKSPWTNPYSSFSSYGHTYITDRCNQ